MIWRTFLLEAKFSYIRTLFSLFINIRKSLPEKWFLTVENWTCDVDLCKRVEWELSSICSVYINIDSTSRGASLLGEILNIRHLNPTHPLYCPLSQSLFQQCDKEEVTSLSKTVLKNQLDFQWPILLCDLRHFFFFFRPQPIWFVCCSLMGLRLPTCNVISP